MQDLEFTGFLLKSQKTPTLAQVGTFILSPDLDMHILLGAIVFFSNDLQMLMFFRFSLDWEED